MILIVQDAAPIVSPVASAERQAAIFLIYVSQLATKLSQTNFMHVYRVHTNFYCSIQETMTKNTFHNPRANKCELVVSAGRGDCCFAIGYWSTAGGNCCKQVSYMHASFLARKWLHLFHNWLLKHRRRQLLQTLFINVHASFFARNWLHLFHICLLKHRRRQLLQTLVKLQMYVHIFVFLLWQEVATRVPQMAAEAPQERQVKY